MSKELVVEVRIPLPEGLFEQADAISRAKNCMNAIQEALPEDLNYSLTNEVVTKRAPRANGAAKPGRKPKSAAQGEGAAA